MSKRRCHFSTNKTLSKIDTLSFFLEIAYIESSQRATSANGKKSNPRQQLSYLFFFFLKRTLTWVTLNPQNLLRKSTYYFLQHLLTNTTSNSSQLPEKKNQDLFMKTSSQAYNLKWTFYPSRTGLAVMFRGSPHKCLVAENFKWGKQQEKISLKY